jgi:hypothetical protein
MEVITEHHRVTLMACGSHRYGHAFSMINTGDCIAGAKRCLTTKSNEPYHKKQRVLPSSLLFVVGHFSEPLVTKGFATFTSSPLYMVCMYRGIRSTHAKGQAEDLVQEC